MRKWVYWRKVVRRNIIMVRVKKVVVRRRVEEDKERWVRIGK